MKLCLSNENFLVLSDQGIVLGHHISSKGIEVDLAKVKIILELPSLQKQKDAKSFLGHAGYYHRFIKYFSKITSPTFILLIKDTYFQWYEECQETFETIKQKIVIALVLQGPKWNLPLHIHSNASNK